MRMQTLKHKIVEEYKKLVKSLQKGKPYDYSYILDMINFTEVKDYIKNSKIIENHFINK